MDKRNSGHRSGRDINSHSGTPNRRAGNPYDTDEFDRYNYVDRDLYSSSKPTRRSSRRGGRYPRKKRGGAKRFLLGLLSLILIVALAAIGYALFMFSRLDRSDAGNTASYVAQPSAAPAWSVKSDSDITNILLIGIDKNEDGSDGRSDTNMLISIDNKTKAIRLVSFLRDTYLEIPTVGKSKLNAAFAHGGPALTMQTLENNYRINIDKYISVNSDNFSAIIDKMGGLDINMNKALCDAENRNMGSHLKPGVNHLNGRLALYYARIRETDSDFGRTGRQREVVELMIKKFRSLNPLEENTIVYEYLPYVKTNLEPTDSEFLSLVSNAGSIPKYQMKTMHVPNEGTYKDETIKGVGAVLVPNLEKNCKLLREFIYGEDENGSTVASAKLQTVRP
jgi:cell envelope-related function transcriptional attenuator common domain